MVRDLKKLFPPLLISIQAIGWAACRQPMGACAPLILPLSVSVANMSTWMLFDQIDDIFVQPHLYFTPSKKGKRHQGQE